MKIKIIKKVVLGLFSISLPLLYSQSSVLFADSFLQYKLFVIKTDSQINYSIISGTSKSEFILQKTGYQYINKGVAIVNFAPTRTNDSIVLGFKGINDTLSTSYILGFDDSIIENQIYSKYKYRALFIWPIEFYGIHSFVQFNPKGRKGKRMDECNISLSIFVHEVPLSAIYSILIKQRRILFTNKQVLFTDILFYGNNFMAPIRKVHLKIKS